MSFQYCVEQIFQLGNIWGQGRSEEHTSELQSPCNLGCRLPLEKKKNTPRRCIRTGSSGYSVDSKGIDLADKRCSTRQELYVKDDGVLAALRASRRAGEWQREGM